MAITAGAERVDDVAAVIESAWDGGCVEVGWRDSAGTACRADLGEVADVAFEDASAAREFYSVPGQRHFPGLWWAATTGRHVGFESWLERDHAMLLDFDPQVVGLASQPITLSWRSPAGRRVVHTPDYFARRSDGRATCPRPRLPVGSRAGRADRPAPCRDDTTSRSPGR